MSALFDWAVIRAVPRPERGECMNVAVVLLCREGAYLDMRVRLDRDRLAALAPDLDLDRLAEQLADLALVCAGGPEGGPIGMLPPHDRFHWLTAPRSTVIQPGPVHNGVCADPAAELDRIAREMLGAPPGG